MTQSPGETSSLLQMRWPRWSRLALKELREILRDRRTLVTLVLMPLLVYPLLGVVFNKVLFSQVGPNRKVEYLVGVESQQDLRDFIAMLRTGEVLQAQAEGKEPAPPGQKPAGTLTDPLIRLIGPERTAPSVNARQMVELREADVGVQLHRDTKTADVVCELIIDELSVHGRAARDFLEQRLRMTNQSFVQNLLAEQTSPERRLPVQLRRGTIKPTSDPAVSLAALAPLVLILMTVTGAVYPAIDLTAGERERGTLEALVATPAPRMEILAGKYVAVLAVAMLTALANTVAMLVTLFSAGLDRVLFGGAFSWLTLVQLFSLLAIFAGFFSAVLLIVTSFARSFKEAQAFIIPLMLLALAPGIFSLLPGLKMTTGLSIMPLVNIVLLARDLLNNEVQPHLAVMACLSTLLYAAGSLVVAGRVFGADALLSSNGGSWRDALQRPEGQGPLSWQLGLMSLAVLFPAFVTCASVVSRLGGSSDGDADPQRLVMFRLIGNATVTILLFAGWPILLAWWNKIPFRAALSAGGAWWGAWVGALLLSVSLWPWAYELELLVIPHEQLEQLQQYFEPLKAALAAIPLPVQLLALAVVPAVCEELFFRGWLFATIQTRLSLTSTVLVTAGFFGLFHTLTVDALLWERFIPTGFMGIMLGLVRGQSRSVWPGVMLHVIHNGLMVSLGVLSPLLMRWGLDLEHRVHLPAVVLVPALLTAAAGLALMWLAGVRSQVTSSKGVAATEM